MDLDVVARARVHREVALDRIPVVVLADELVEVVVAGGLRERAPAAGEQRGVAVALALQRAVGGREPLVLLGDPPSTSITRSIQRGIPPAFR